MDETKLHNDNLIPEWHKCLNASNIKAYAMLGIGIDGRIRVIQIDSISKKDLAAQLRAVADRMD